VLLKIRQNETTSGVTLSPSRRELLIESERIIHASRINTALRHGIKWDNIIKFDLDNPALSNRHFEENLNALKEY